jgi:4-amino-4-deoxy-L-arabinose transferase-like glycosyltransferase
MELKAGVAKDRFHPFWLVAVGIILLTVVIRLPALLHPQAIDDEAVYSVVANELVDGGRPYIDAVERKPPLLFWTYAAVFEVAGKFNWAALHTVALVWTVGTMAGLYVIGRRLFDRETGLIAALLYSVFQPWGERKNLAFNGELMMNLPLVWAYAIALGRGSSRARLELLAAGALLCAGFLLKQPAAIAALPLGMYLLLPDYRRERDLTPSASFAHAALLTVGFFATLGFVLLVLRQQGILAEAFYWTITNHPIHHVFWDEAILITTMFVGACLPLLIGAVVAYRYPSIWAEKTAERAALVGWLIASVAGAAAGARFYPHYYIQLIPPLALLAAPCYARLWKGKMEPPHWLLRPRVTGVWLALTILVFSLAHWIGLISRREPSETGRYLRANSNQNDRIFIWGQAPYLYLEAQRRPACRYVIPFPLTGHVFGGLLPGTDTRKWIVPGAWSHFEEDCNKHPPAYIVVLHLLARDAQYPVSDFPVLDRLLANRYQPVAATHDAIVYRMR